jgi:hypothetical protein
MDYIGFNSFSASENIPQTSDLAGDGDFCHDYFEKKPYTPVTPQNSSYEELSDIEKSLVGFGVLALTIWSHAKPEAADPVIVTTPGDLDVALSQTFIDCNDNIPSAEEYNKEDTTVKEEDYYSVRGKLIDDTYINGMWFEYNSFMTFYPSHGVKSGVLLEDAEGYPDVWFAAGTEIVLSDNETFYRDASVRSGVLAKPATLSQYEITFSKGTYVEYHPNGKFKKAKLPENTRIKDILYKKGTVIEFRESGNIKGGIPAEDVTLHDMTFPAGTDRLVFSDSGNFKGAKLPYDLTMYTEYGQVTMSKKKWIGFYTEGNLLQGTPIHAVDFYLDQREERPIAHVISMPLKEVTFHESGYLKRCTLKDPVTIDDITYKEGTEIEFYENGLVKEGRHVGELSLKDFVAYDIIFRDGGQIFFYESGVLQGGSVKGEFTTNFKDDNKDPITFMGDRYIGFYENGILMSGRITQDTKIKGFLLKQGEFVDFDEEGRVIKGIIAQDKSMFPEIYDNQLWYREGSELNVRYKSKGRVEYKAEILNDIEFTATIADITATFAIEKGKKLQVRNDGSIKGGTLKDDVLALYCHDEPVYFKGGSWFGFGEDDDKEYVEGTMMRDISVYGHELKEDQVVDFYLSGYVAGYEGEEIFEPFAKRYPDLWLGGENKWMTFYDVQTLMEDGYVTEDEIARDKNLVHYSGGHLAQDYLAYPDLYDDLWFKEGWWVGFDEVGNLAGGKLKEDTPVSLPEFDNVILKGDQWVEFYTNGMIKSAVVAEDVYYDHPFYDEVVLKAGTRIELFEDGFLKSGILGEKFELNNIVYDPINSDYLVFRAGHKIKFFDFSNGHSIRYGVLDEDYSIFTPQLSIFDIAGGFKAWFYPFETLERGSLLDHRTFGGLIFTVEFRGKCDFEKDTYENGGSKCDIEFREDETLRCAHAANGGGFDNYVYDKHSAIYYDEYSYHDNDLQQTERYCQSADDFFEDLGVEDDSEDEELLSDED